MKTTLLTSLFLISIVYSQGQELTVSLHGGVSGISYKSDVGEGSLELGGGIGIGYTHFLNEHWGLQTGVEARLNRNTFTLDNNRQFTTYEIDDQGSAFEYRVSADGYEEDQKFYSFSIPLMLQYHTMFSDKTGVYFGLGGKVLFTGKQDIEANAEALALSGYYPDLNLEIDDLPAHGFGSISNWEGDSKVSLKTSVLLSAEGGLVFKLKDRLNLYTGIYVDYGLMDLQDADAYTNIVSYSPERIEGVSANGVLAMEDVVENSNYISAGVQLKLGFGLGAKKQSLEEEEDVVIVEEAVEVQEPKPVVVAKQPKEELEKPTFTDSEFTYIKEPLIFGNIDQTQVPEPLAERLNTIAHMVNKDETVKLHIMGHTCDLGSESLNQRIGLERAEAVADYLETQGVSRDRMKLISKGEEDPLVPNTSHDNRAKNRRVSIDLIF
ncbi:OmpA family protein [Galbibacter sp.]|uniref:OmpA family protein n=1 Tax=Galbibacter sp. TaxID=2918471 RepID=UPI003A90138D